VLGGVEVFGGIVADVELEERGGGDAEGGEFGFTGGRYFEPADVGVVAVFLGHDVVHVFGGDGGLVAGDEAAGFAVGVVFDGAASEVGEIFVAGHEVEADADAGEIGHVGGAEGDDVVHDEASVGVQGVAVRVGAVFPIFASGGGVRERDSDRAVLVGFVGEGVWLVLERLGDEADFLPAAEGLPILLGPEFDAVVVGGGAVEFDEWGAGEEFDAAHAKRGERGRSAVEGHGGVAGAEEEAVRGVFDQDRFAFDRADERRFRRGG